MMLRSTFHVSLFLMVVFGLTAVSAQAQSTSKTNVSEAPLPVVVVVPPDELSRSPSLSPATAHPKSKDPVSAVMATPVQVVAKASTSEPKILPAKHSFSRCDVPGSSIAMTFDDGPHPKLTPQLLDILKERGIKATFYVIGKNVAAYPEIVRRMVDEGHEVANHSWSHPKLTGLSAQGLKSEIEKTSKAIEDATGQRPLTMRPPYGATNKALEKKMDEEFGMKVIMWSVDPQDWRYRNAKRVASHITENTKAGDIVLAHDIHATTVAAMPEALDSLKAAGFQFVTVSNLLAMEGAMELVAKEERPRSSD